jgi:cell division protein FtsX
MTRISHLLREIARNLYRNPGTAFSSFLSLTLLFLLFDLFWVAAGTSDVFYRDLLSDIRMEVFLNEEVTDSLVPDMEFRVAQVQGVQAIERVTKEQAREELSRLVGTDLLASI